MTYNRQTNRLHGRLMDYTKELKNISASLFIKKRLRSSNYFVQYLAVINHTSFKDKFFIVYKPIKLGDPNYSSYRIIRNFLHFIKTEKQLKKKPQFCKDTYEYLQYCQQKLKPQIKKWIQSEAGNRAKIRKQDDILRRELFENKYVQNFTNSGSSLLKQYREYKKKGFQLPLTPYHKLFYVNLDKQQEQQKNSQTKRVFKMQKTKHRQQTQSILISQSVTQKKQQKSFINKKQQQSQRIKQQQEQQKQQANKQYSEYFMQFLKSNIEVKLSYFKLQQLNKICQELKWASIFSGTSANIKQTFIVHQYPYKRIYNNAQNIQPFQQEVTEAFMNQLSLQQIFIKNACHRVQKVKSQRKRMIGFAFFQLMHSYKGLKSQIYPYHPKYQIYNNKRDSSYRLAPDPLYLKACGMQKQPLNHQQILIQSYCKPIYDIYRLIDQYFETEKIYQDFEQKKLQMIKDKNFINFVKFAFGISQFKTINCSFLGKINVASKQDKFKQIKKFIQKVFISPLQNEKQKIKMDQQQNQFDLNLEKEVQCDIHYLGLIEHYIHVQVLNKVKEQKQTNSRSIKPEQIKKQLQSKVILRIQIFEDIFSIYSQIFNSQNLSNQEKNNQQSHSNEEEQRYFYFYQFQGDYNFIGKIVFSWFNVQLKKDSTSKSKFLIYSLGYLLHYIYFLTFEQFLIEYYQNEVFKLKKKKIRDKRLQLYLDHEESLSKYLAQIQKQIKKLQLNKQLSSIKQENKQFIQFIASNNQKKKIKQKINGNFKYWTDGIIEQIKNYQNEEQCYFFAQYNYQKNLKQVKKQIKDMFNLLGNCLMKILNQYFEQKIYIGQNFIQKRQDLQARIIINMFCRFSTQSYSEFSLFIFQIKQMQQQNGKKNQIKKIVLNEDMIQRIDMKSKQYKPGGYLIKQPNCFE